MEASLTRLMDGSVELSVQQMCEAWRLMSRDSPRLRMSAGDGIDYIFSGLPVAFFNVAVLTRPSISAAALRQYGDEARAWAADTNVPWFFVLTHEALEAGVDPQAVLAECGLAPALPLTGMFAARVSPVTGRLPAGLQVTVPHDDAGCGAVLDVNSAAYEMDLEPAKTVLGVHAFWNAHVAVLGTVDGAPASSAAVLIVDGYRYVALVATDPAHRRRGYADAVMRHALDVAAAAHGELATVLHATDAGRPIYERMGYAPISTHTLYMDKAFLGEH